MAQPQWTPSYEDFGLVGPSPDLERARRAIREYGPTDMPVLVTGETGTGKDLVARGLHRTSSRAAGPFVPVNCAAISPSLFESEFFGSRRGSFTGADRDRGGLIAAAEGGTLFLDEVGELPLDLQPKLLRLLESGRYRPVGGREEKVAKVRTIAATNRDLRLEVRSNRFRADLYYRLDVLHVHLSSLRERPGDLLPLVQHFLARAGAPHRRLSPESLESLQAWPWPGNVREVAHVVARALVTSPAGPLASFELGRLEAPEPVKPRIAAGPNLASTRDEFLERQRVSILHHLNEQRWNVSAAARALGWSRGALRSRMRRLGL